MLNKIGNVKCEMCGKERKRISNNHNLCQVCYRKLLKKYSFYCYKDENKKLRGNIKEICKMTVEDNINKVDIAKKLNLNVNYVRKVVKENCNHCDTNGEIRPSFLDK